MKALGPYLVESNEMQTLDNIIKKNGHFVDNSESFAKDPDRSNWQAGQIGWKNVMDAWKNYAPLNPEEATKIWKKHIKKPVPKIDVNPVQEKMEKYKKEFLDYWTEINIKNLLSGRYIVKKDVENLYLAINVFYHWTRDIPVRNKKEHDYIVDLWNRFTKSNPTWKIKTAKDIWITPRSILPAIVKRFQKFPGKKIELEFKDFTTTKNSQGLHWTDFIDSKFV